MDGYVAEFLRLCRFALFMVSDEEKRAERFQQGVKMDIHMLLIPQQLKTYAQILTVAREIERGLIRKEKNQVREDLLKKPFHKNIKRRPVVHLVSPPLAK